MFGSQIFGRLSCKFGIKIGTDLAWSRSRRNKADALRRLDYGRRIMTGNPFRMDHGQPTMYGSSCGCVDHSVSRESDLRRDFGFRPVQRVSFGFEFGRLNLDTWNTIISDLSDVPVQLERSAPRRASERIRLLLHDCRGCTVWLDLWLSAW